MPTTRTRAASALVAAALGLTPLALGALGSTAHAASRSAQTSVDTSYLSDALGLPSETAVETVTYDRFQWLLQQPGQFAFLIGSATDAGFGAKAVAADAAARAAGVTKVYWFDPNLSGYTDNRNLNTRNPGGINLAAASQTVFGNTWKHLLGAYLGNGIKSAAASSTTVTITADDAVVNDAVDPLWDYRSDKTPVAGISDDLFFVYDKDHTASGAADKILAWTDLTTAADPTAVTGAVTADLSAAGGGSTIDAIDQFHWWKSAANSKHAASYADPQRYGGDILTDADAADGWRIKQVTYPELLHLLDLQQNAQQNFAVLFGGTWCHNTRAVLKDVNAQAQDNDVKVVYNFDLVLDGGTTNGANGGSNPIHIRDSANSATETRFRPSYLYGDLVRTYLKNVVTEYDANTGSRVSYYPKGDTAAFPDVVRKLQVPFLVNYQRGTAQTPSSTAVKRQWIQQNSDPSTGLATFKEYMSEWWFTHPSGTRLGLNPTFTTVASPGYPAELAIPASADAADAAPASAFLTATEKTTLSPEDQTSVVGARRNSVKQALTNAVFGTEAVARLKTFFGGLPGGVVSDQVVRALPAKVGSTATVNVSIANDYGRIPTGQVTLKIAGRTVTAAVKNASASFALAGLPVGSHAYTLSYAGDDQIVGFTKTGSLSITKATVSKVSAKVTKAPTSKKAGTATVSVTTAGAKATGAVTLTLTKGTKKASVKATLTRTGTATVTLPKLAKGSWKVTVSYAGDATYLKAASATTTLKVIK